MPETPTDPASEGASDPEREAVVPPAVSSGDSADPLDGGVARFLAEADAWLARNEQRKRDASTGGPPTDGPAGPPPSSPTPDEPISADPPLRPVDWDGSSSSTWRSRDDNNLANRLAAQHDIEWDRAQLDQKNREWRERIRAELEQEARDERERRMQEWERAESERSDDARSRLFAKLDRLDRGSGETVADPPSEDPGIC
jgi:hypothetical protein